MAQHVLAQANPSAPDAQAERRGADVLVIRFEVDDSLTSLPPALLDLVGQEAGRNMAEACRASPVDTTAAQVALGRRTLHPITIETHTPQCCDTFGSSESDRTYAEATANHSPPSSARERGGGGGGGGGGGLPEAPVALGDKITFFSGIPVVECMKGVMHLYRHRLDPTPSRLVCVLCIPAHFNLSDMLTFLSSVLSNVHSLRVIRDSTPNQYMLLLKFKDKSKAEDFFSHYRGRHYSSLDAAACQMVYVSRVQIEKSSQGLPVPGPGLVELPSCPVCLEKLDDSVLTILCNHSFHTHCLTRWEDSTCPVCRYTQSPEPSGDSMCMSCDSKEDLWICLICGNIGCGRYVGCHAHTHFVQTQHTFAMQLGTQRVWDYIGDNYVHRLVQNKEDGKLVEVPGQEGMIRDEEKIDSLQLEYTYLLTSQLESQRLFFEEKLARVEKEANEELASMELRCRSAVSEKRGLEEKFSEVEKDKRAIERKHQQLQQRVTKLSGQLKEEKELNKCLSDNQKLWKDRVSSLEKKIDATIYQKEQEMKELQEQVRDLMFYLEAQKKIAASPEGTRQEIQEGQLVMTQGAAASSSSSTPRKGRKKK